MNKNAEILIAAAEDAKDIARLSYQVGKMHDEALPDYFKPTTEEEHLVIVRKMMADDNMFLLKAVYDRKNLRLYLFFLYRRHRETDMYITKIGYIYNFGVDEMWPGAGSWFVFC